MNQGIKRQDKKERKIKIRSSKKGKKRTKNCVRESEQINRRVLSRTRAGFERWAWLRYRTFGWGARAPRTGTVRAPGGKASSLSSLSSPFEGGAPRVQFVHGPPWPPAAFRKPSVPPEPRGWQRMLPGGGVRDILRMRRMKSWPARTETRVCSRRRRSERERSAHVLVHRSEAGAARCFGRLPRIACTWCTPRAALPLPAGRARLRQALLDRKSFYGRTVLRGNLVANKKKLLALENLKCRKKLLALKNLNCRKTILMCFFPPI